MRRTALFAALLLVVNAGCSRRENAPQTATPEELREGEEASEGALDTRPVVLFDGRTILARHELDARLHTLVTRYEETPGQRRSNAAWRDTRRQQLIDRAIHRELLRAFIQTHATLPTSEETLETLRAENPHVFGNDDIFERFLRARDIDRAEYLEQEGFEIALHKILLSRGLSPPSEDEVQTYYRSQRDRLRAGERILVSTITLRLPADAPPSLVESRRAQLEAARRQLEGGHVAFEDVARDIGQGIENEQGGDLGWIQRGSDRMLVVNNVEDQLFALPPNSYAPAVRTLAGVQLFWVRDHRPAGIRPLDEVRESMEQPLYNQRKRALREQLLEELRTNALIEVDRQAAGFELE